MEALFCLVKEFWQRGYIPQQLCWVIVVLIPKGRGEYHGIGLLEAIWKVIESIMDQQMNVIEFNDVLHGFCNGRGTGMAITEAKLAQ